MTSKVLFLSIICAKIYVMQSNILFSLCAQKSHTSQSSSTSLMRAYRVINLHVENHSVYSVRVVDLVEGRFEQKVKGLFLFDKKNILSGWLGLIN